MEQPPDPSAECSRCSVPILDSDLVQRDHGQLHHVHCDRSPTSDERVREHREIRGASDAAFDQDAKRPARAPGLRDEAPAVLCEICQTGIGSFAELALADSGPTHVHCRPTP